MSILETKTDTLLFIQIKIILFQHISKFEFDFSPKALEYIQIFKSQNMVSQAN